VCGPLQRRAYYSGLYVGSNSGPFAARDFGDFTSPSEWFGITYQWFDGVYYVDAQENLYGSKSAAIATGYKAFTLLSGPTRLTLFEKAEEVRSLLSDQQIAVQAQQDITLFRSQSSQSPLRTYSFAVLAQGLTPAQHSTLYDLIQNYQTAMGRAV
jgi:hypothetical protein